ncbi:hypothetical protein HYFRA_00002034 [Hymenoscyphus fraxineus]|uniref:CorA-like transporter domain-containing protein n=1 Tax=Hymenoscyphus fraxineus TaxID=746836 RepID=A0A9N9PMP5_9HELO|nr:hypothetical protein HYFRA_00002034 [Hymenoscyphus fraxineus]
MSYQSLFLTACENVDKFPKNTIRSSTSRNHLDSFFRRLNEQDRRIFYRDNKASVNIWEFQDNEQAFQNQCITNSADLETHLHGSHLLAREDPRCRFIFIHAPTSRDILRVSRKMFGLALTYHQVMPNFLDFVFPFGFQEYAEDFCFSGFREDSRLFSKGGLKIMELGRSGQEIRVCYSLKSVESSDRESWPWSVRQTSIYHSFDVVTGKAIWIVIKGSHLIKERVQESTKENSDDNELKSFETAASSFSSTLAMHLVLCDWCDEDWRWYLTFLEKRLHDLTRHSLAVDIPEASQYVDPGPFRLHKRSSSGFRSTISRKITSRKSTLDNPTDESFRSSFLMSPISSINEVSPQMPPNKIDLPPGFSLPPSLPPGKGGPKEDNTTNEVLSVKTLQQVQFVEDKANEVLLVLEANIKIVRSIRNHYQAILNSEDCPGEIRLGSKTEFSNFEKRISNIISDLEIQRSTAETLLRLLENRKSLLSALLNLNTIEASKEVSVKSQQRESKMQEMTEAMHQLAVDTKRETVSMRIITLVTLFFLPGTFISTIMSTDIIKFEDSEKKFELGALQLYLYITVPLMAITFAAWWVVYIFIDRRQGSNFHSGNALGSQVA